MIKRTMAAVLAFLLLIGASGCAERAGVTVPILLYHHLTETGNDASDVSVESFRRQMALLKTEGYQPISFDTLIDYVENGTALPEKPVIITFDDGYYSNYQYAYPILCQYGYPAAIFVIGCSVGHLEYYKDTTYPLTPHFGAEEIAEMCESGLIAIQSHTYDMHQWAPYESGEAVRESILPLEGESEEVYIAALTADHQKEAELLLASGAGEIRVVAYPGGKTCALANTTLQELGVAVTLTTDPERLNRVQPGEWQTLIDMGRLSINEATTDQEILEYLSKK